MGVVLEHALAGRTAVLPRPAEPAVRAEESGEDRIGCPRRDREVRLAAGQEACAVRQRTDREAVPRGKGLVVASRLGACAAPLEKSRPGLGELALDRGTADRRRHPRQDVRVLPVPVARHAVGQEEGIGRLAEHVADLVGGPGEGLALDALRVGVLAGSERSVVASKLTDHVVERPDGDILVASIPGQREGVRVDAGELGVVVEHLLEVRDEPDRRRSSSGGSRRRADRGSRRRPSHRDFAARPRADARHRSQPRAGGGTRSSSAGGTSVRRPSRRSARRSWPRSPRSPRRAAPVSVRPHRRSTDRSAAATRASTSRWPAAMISSAFVAPGPGDAGEELAERRHPVRRAAGGSRCRRRTACRRASGRGSSASRPGRSSPGPRPCRPGRGPDAPRDRPSPRRSPGSGPRPWPRPRSSRAP